MCNLDNSDDVVKSLSTGTKQTVYVLVLVSLTMDILSVQVGVMLLYIAFHSQALGRDYKVEEAKTFSLISLCLTAFSYVTVAIAFVFLWLFLFFILVINSATTMYVADNE